MRSYLLDDQQIRHLKTVLLDRYCIEPADMKDDLKTYSLLTCCCSDEELVKLEGTFRDFHDINPNIEDYELHR